MKETITNPFEMVMHVKVQAAVSNSLIVSFTFLLFLMVWSPTKIAALPRVRDLSNMRWASLQQDL